MRQPGLLGTIQLAGALVLALPVGLFGVVLLAEGRLLGVAFLGVGALMVLVPWRLTNPLDPVDVADAAIDRVTDGDEE